MHRVLRILALFASLVVLSACCTATLRPLSTVDLAKIASDATVALVSNKDGSILPYCTGIWVSETNILTAGHCIVHNDEDDSEPKEKSIAYILQNEATEVRKPPSAIHFSTILAVNSDMDLALLQVVNPNSVPAHTVAKLADKTPSIGEHLNIVGHPKGLYWSYIGGFVAGYRNTLPIDDPSGPFLQVSAPVFFGNSGGGAFNDKGELVGLVSFLAPVPNTAMFIHLETIRGWLRTNKLVSIK